MRMAGQPSMTSTPGAWWRGPLVVVAAILGLIVMLSPDASITTRSTTAVAATTPTRTVTYGYDGAHQQPPARPSEARFRIRGGTRLASLAVHSVGQVRPASVSVLAAEAGEGAVDLATAMARARSSIGGIENQKAFAEVAWGGGGPNAAAAARSLIGTRSAAQLSEQGITLSQATAWRDAYQAAVQVGRGTASEGTSAARLDLMNDVIRTLGG